MVAVVVAGVASFALGWAWYGPLFGKPWMRMVGIAKPDHITPSVKKQMMKSALGGLICALLMAYVFAHALMFANGYMNTEGVASNLQGAFWHWLGFIVPVTSGIVLWEGKPKKLWLINAGYYLVSLALMAVILGSM